MLSNLASSEFLIFTITLLLSFELPFWIFNGYLLYIQSEYSDQFEKYRLQKRKPKLNSKQQPEMFNTIIRQTIGQQIVMILATPLIYYLLKWRGLEISATLPDLKTMILHLLIFIFSEDALFFWSHYLLHTKFLFNTVHYRHHKFYQPIGLTSVLAHPVESFVGNQVPVWLAPIFTPNKHMITISIWVVIRVLQTVNAHCGYNLPYVNPRKFLPWLHGGAEMHDYHHRKVEGNYGSFFTLWDRLMGTYRTDSKKD